jgi:hypothetical protein
MRYFTLIELNKDNLFDINDLDIGMPYLITEAKVITGYDSFVGLLKSKSSTVLEFIEVDDDGLLLYRTVKSEHLTNNDVRIKELNIDF